MSKYINDKIVDKSKEVSKKNKFFKLKKNNLHLIHDKLIDEAEEIVDKQGKVGKNLHFITDELIDEAEAIVNRRHSNESQPEM